MFTAQQALKSPYFIRKPLPCPSHLLPKPVKQEKESLADTKNLPIGISLHSCYITLWLLFFVGIVKKLEYE